MVSAEGARRSALQIAFDILTAPSAAFLALRERPTILLPLLVVMIGGCAATAWYYTHVDIAWFIGRQLDAAGTQMPADARRKAIEGATALSPYIWAGGAAAGTAIFTLLIPLLAAGYLAIVSQITNDGIGYRSWFSLLCWCSLPLLFSYLAMAVNFAVNGVAHLPPENLYPLSVSNLFGMTNTATAAGSTLRWITLPTLWSLGLVTYGYSVWTKKSLMSATLIVVVPLLVLGALIVTLVS